MTAPFKQQVADPQLPDVLDMLKQNVFRDLNCHAIATVKEFNIKSIGSSFRAMVTAQINYHKTYFSKDTGTGQYTPKLFPYPLLVDCPAIIFSGGRASLQLPISVGDQCLILFNDRDIDNWNKGAINSGVNTPRMHSLSDGIALVGLNILPDSDYDSDRAVLKNGDAMVALGEDLIEISNATRNLKTILNNLITAVNSLVSATAAITVLCSTPGSPSGPPINAAAINAVTTSLNNVATQLGELLE